MIRIINKLKTLTDLPLIPLSSDKLQEQIIYNITPFSDNGIVSQYTLQLNIICETLAKADDIDKTIRRGILSFGDTNTTVALSIELNGGGTLQSEKYIHRIVNYSIKLKD